MDKMGRQQTKRKSNQRETNIQADKKADTIVRNLDIHNPSNKDVKDLANLRGKVDKEINSKDSGEELKQWLLGLIFFTAFLVYFVIDLIALGNSITNCVLLTIYGWLVCALMVWITCKSLSRIYKTSNDTKKNSRHKCIKGTDGKFWKCYSILVIIYSLLMCIYHVVVAWPQISDRETFFAKASEFAAQMGDSFIRSFMPPALVLVASILIDNIVEKISKSDKTWLYNYLALGISIISLAISIISFSRS